MLRIRPASRLAVRAVRQQAVRRPASVTFKRLQSTTEQAKKEGAPPPPPAPSGSNAGVIAGLLIAALGGGYWYYSKNAAPAPKTEVTAQTAKFEDYQKVYDAIAKKLEDEDDYEDGSYGPLLVRLAWHSSGTYDKNAGDGGSSAGTMRFEKEAGYDANNGLYVGKDFLKSIHQQFPWISYGDLYTLGGVAAVQEMQGPAIRWRAGRVDEPVEKTTPDGRLPDGSKGASHVREVFYRMGFNDQEIVALLGAHALGRCHTDRSGFDGPWTFSPTVFTNDYFTLLVDEKWHFKKWNGPKQYEDDKTNSLMMLPADYALVQDKKLKEWAVKYARDNELFFKDFSAAFEKLLELGVKFQDATPHWTFKSKNGTV